MGKRVLHIPGIFFFYSVGILFYKISKYTYYEKIKLYMTNIFKPFTPLFEKKNCSNTEHNQNQVMIITILH